MIRKQILVMLLIVFSITTPGCWDLSEVNRKATTNVLFLDLLEDKQVKLGCSFNIPGSMLPPYVGTEQLFSKRYYTLSGTGIGLLDAWQDLQSVAFRDVFFGQIRAIVISEEFAKEDIHTLLDFTGRRVQIPSETYMLVTKQNPEELLDIKNNNNFLPGDYIEQYFHSPAKTPVAQPTRLWEVYSILTNQSSDVYMPLIEVNQGQYKIAGTALFSGNRMVGELNFYETQLFSLYQGSKSGYLTVPLSDKRLIAFQEIKSKSSVRTSIGENGQPHFDLELKMSGLLRETKPRDTNVTLDDKQKYEQWAENYTKQQFLQLLSKLQSLNSDPLNLGRSYRIAYPKQWESINWHDVYPNASFTVNTDFTIVNTGLLK